MLKYVITFLGINRLSFAISQNLNGMATFFQYHFAGTGNLRIVSIILLLLAFVLFLFLIVILYIKSLLSFIKESEASLGAPVAKSIEDQEMEKELEKEFERDMDTPRAKRQEQKTQADLLAKKQKESEKQKKKEEQERKEKLQAIPLPTSFGDSAFRGKASMQEFDWKTGRQGELDEAAAGLSSVNSFNKGRPLIDLTGLIIDMLGRDIDPAKIAQTIRSKCQGYASEEDIIQAIDAIQNFISLSNNGRFYNLKNQGPLPTPENALIALSNGDTGPALSLMEALINTMVDKAAQTDMAQKRDIIFVEASNHACTFGSLASLEDDPSLAVSAFELALELSPKNANAWSRTADAYLKSKTDSKAVWAYQNVLSFADQDAYPHQIANANQKLAQYYEKQGDLKKASELYYLSNAYYSTIGINTRLTDKEQNIIDIIESKQHENMQGSIGKLLNLSKKKIGNFM